MQIPVPLAWLKRASALALILAAGVVRADDVAARIHFAGASGLSRQASFATATKLLDLPTSVDFQRLVLRRFADYLATGLPVSNPNSSPLLQPLLSDALRAESVTILGGTQGQPPEFVIALHLDAAQSRLWDANFAKACGSGAALNVGNGHGLVWGQGSQTTLSLLHDGEWTIITRGSGFDSVRNDILAKIEKNGRPSAALSDDFLQADVDWPKLQQLLPINLSDLKLARTEISVKAGADQIFHTTAHVVYPESINWTPQPWNVPLKLISDPLISFTAARDISPFLNQDPFSAFSQDPFPSQYYCWAMSGTPFQSYMAWPVPNASNEIRRLSSDLPTTFGPNIKTLNGGVFHYNPKQNQISWNATLMNMVAPTLTAGQSDSDSFIVAGLFPLGRQTTRPPADLFAQFTHSDDTVYYDWEITGPRLEEWRLLTELLPIVHKMTRADAVQEKAQMDAFNSANHAQGERYRASFVVSDNWLAALAPHLTNDTTTQITKTGPAELTIKRRSPFLFTALELEMLTHWMAHAPSVGHIDPALMPPRAKVTGPGMH